jgi:hypothetical protein
MLFVAFYITCFLFIAIGGYFLPTIVGLLRHKKNILPIFLLNFCLGLTFIAWVVALVWAFMYEDKDNI